jgi:hypothetical protein
MFLVRKVTPVHAHSFTSKRYELFEMWDSGQRTMKQWIFCGAGNQVNFTSVVTRLQARQPRNYDFIPGKDKRFFIPPKCPGQLLACPASCSVCNGGYFLKAWRWPHIHIVARLRMSCAVSHSLILCNGLHRGSFVLFYLFVSLVWEGGN